jgi:hypothetical protein
MFVLTVSVFSYDMLNYVRICSSLMVINLLSSELTYNSVEFLKRADFAVLSGSTKSTGTTAAYRNFEETC